MVGIIPKPIKKPSKLYQLSPYIVLGLVAAVILVYAALLYFENQASTALQDLQEQIAQVGTGDEKTIEAQVLLDKQKIDDFSEIFANHQRASNFFKFLEENCHPNVWFGKLELNTQDDQATLSGEAAGFETLGQQIVIFQNQKLIKNVELSDFAVGTNGRVNFTLSLSLDPAIFNNNE